VRALSVRLALSVVALLTLAACHYEDSKGQPAPTSAIRKCHHDDGLLIDDCMERQGYRQTLF